MNLFKSSRPIFTLCLLAVTLVACDTLDDAKFWRDPKPEPCPRITVLGDATEKTQFKDGSGRDLIDVLYEARIVNVFSACKYDVDYDNRDGIINIQLAPQIAAKRGPADQNRFGDLEYFIAVVDAEKNILEKDNFKLRMGFPGNLTQNTLRDEPVDLAIVTDGSTDGRDYEIYVGFQLTAEQIEFNKRKRTRR